MRGQKVGYLCWVIALVDKFDQLVIDIDGMEYVYLLLPGILAEGFYLLRQKGIRLMQLNHNQFK